MSSAWEGGTAWGLPGGGGATPDLAAVLAEGNSAAGPIRLGRGTAAAPAYALSPDGVTGLWNSQSGTEDISFTIDGVQAAHFWRAAAGRVLLNFHGSGEIAGSGSTGLKVTNIGVVWLGNETVMLGRGAGSPEGVVTAPSGSIYLRTGDGGAGSTFYVKESGTGNTGWVPK